MKKFFGTKWILMLKIVPVLALIMGLKMATHYFGIEFLTFSAFFSALISANIFLIGFILSGVLSDYKEAEKIPGEIASNIDSIADEFDRVQKSRDSIQRIEQQLRNRLKHQPHAYIHYSVDSNQLWFDRKFGASDTRLRTGK